MAKRRKWPMWRTRQRNSVWTWHYEPPERSMENRRWRNDVAAGWSLVLQPDDDEAAGRYWMGGGD